MGRYMSFHRKGGDLDDEDYEANMLEEQLMSPAQTTDGNTTKGMKMDTTMGGRTKRSESADIVYDGGDAGAGKNEEIELQKMEPVKEEEGDMKYETGAGQTAGAGMPEMMSWSWMICRGVM